MTMDIVKEVIIPIISILTFVLSVAVLFVESYTKRRRLIGSKPVRLARFSELKFKHKGLSHDMTGIVVSFNIINPSPHDIGVSNFKFVNDGNFVLIETNPRFNHVFLDNIIETFPYTTHDFIIKSNSQKRVTFLIMNNELQNLSYNYLEIYFDAIFNDWSFPFRRPISFARQRHIPLKTYHVKGKIKEKLP